MENKKATLSRKLTFDDAVIEKIVGLVCRNVEGILSLDGGVISELAGRLSKKTDPTKGIDAEVGDTQVALDMDATIEYGSEAPKIFDEVCNRTQQAIKNYTGLDLVELNLNINDVLTKKEWQAKSERQKDELATAGANERVQ
ncbi:Asp23/Gls24 family envelope stress response protein [Secundilactobacillus folii]